MLQRTLCFSLRLPKTYPHARTHVRTHVPRTHTHTSSRQHKTLHQEYIRLNVINHIHSQFISGQMQTQHLSITGSRRHSIPDEDNALNAILNCVTLIKKRTMTPFILYYRLPLKGCKVSLVIEEYHKSDRHLLHNS